MHSRGAVVFRWNSAYISRSECFRYFKKFINKNPMEFTNEFRLSKASELLLETDKSIEFISSSCGFNSSSYFCKIFWSTLNEEKQKRQKGPSRCLRHSHTKSQSWVNSQCQIRKRILTHIHTTALLHVSYKTLCLCFSWYLQCCRSYFAAYPEVLPVHCSLQSGMCYFLWALKKIFWAFLRLHSRPVKDKNIYCTVVVGQWMSVVCLFLSLVL